MNLVELLKTKEGYVSVLDNQGKLSVAITTERGLEYKWISRELYDLLVKELGQQEGEYHNCFKAM